MSKKISAARMLAAALVLAELLVLASLGRAEESVNGLAGQASPLQNAGLSARALGMGGAFVGVADDGSAALWNPAGLAALNEATLGLHHNAFLVDTSQDTLIYTAPLSATQGIGISADYVNYGNFDVRDSNGTLGGSVGVSEFRAGAAYGFNLAQGMALGAGFSSTRQSLAGQDLMNFNGNLAALWQASEFLKFGFQVNAAGGSGDFQAGPARLGASAKLFRQSDYPLLLALSSTLGASNAEMQAGVEESLHSLLKLRAGWNQNVAGEASLSDGGAGQFSFGGGVNLQGFDLDYAFIPYGALGTTQRLSLTYYFEASKMAESAPKEQAPPAAQAAREDTYSAFYVQGSAHLVEGDTQKALEIFREGAALNPKDAACWAGMAQAYEKMGRQDYAATCYRTVLQIRPADPLATGWLKSHP